MKRQSSFAKRIHTCSSRSISLSCESVFSNFTRQRLKRKLDLNCHPERTREGSSHRPESKIFREYAQDDIWGLLVELCTIDKIHPSTEKCIHGRAAQHAEVRLQWSDPRNRSGAHDAAG